MRKTIRLGLCCLALFAPTVRATAQPTDDVVTDRAADGTTAYDFRDGDDVDGRAVGPDGSLVRPGVRPARPTLIRARVSFVPELVASASRR